MLGDDIFTLENVEKLIAKNALSKETADKIIQRNNLSAAGDQIDEAKDTITSNAAMALQQDPMAREMLVETVKKSGLTANDLAPFVIGAESSGNPKAVSPVGAQGLMQLMPATGQEMFTKLGMQGQYNPFDPEQNKTIGTAYLQEQIDKFGDPRIALAAYNAGPGNVMKAIQATGTPTPTFEQVSQFLPKPQETVPYVDKVMSQYMKAAPTPVPAPTPNGVTGSWDTPAIPKEEMVAAKDTALAEAGNAVEVGDGAAAISATKNAFELEKLGAIQEMAAAENAGKETQAYLNGKYTEAEKLAAERGVQRSQYQKELDDRITLQKKLVDEYGSMTIDPKRFYSKQTTGQKIAAAIGLALSGLSGQDSKAMSVIEGAVNEDIALQKANMAIKKEAMDQNVSLIQLMRQRVGDSVEADKMVEATYWNRVQNQLTGLTANIKGEEQRAKGTQLLAQIEQKKQKAILDAQQAASSNIADMIANQGQDEKDPMIARFVNADPKRAKLIVSGLGVARSPEDAKNITDAHEGYKEAKVILNKLRELRKDVGTETFKPNSSFASKESVEAAEMSANFVSIWRLMEKAGALDEGSIKLVERILPSDPLGDQNIIGKLVTGNDTLLARLDALENSLDRKYAEKLDQRLLLKTPKARSIILGKQLRSGEDAQDITDSDKE